MPRFPVVDDDGCFDHETIPLTKPLLGFYVKNRPTGQVSAYADGLWDVCTLIQDAISKPEAENFTMTQFKQQIQDIISERYGLMSAMHSYVAQTQAEKCKSVDPS